MIALWKLKIFASNLFKFFENSFQTRLIRYLSFNYTREQQKHVSFCLTITFYSRRIFDFHAFRLRNTVFWISSMIPIWKPKIFASNLLHSIAFVALKTSGLKTCIFRRKIIFYSQRNHNSVILVCGTQ